MRFDLLDEYSTLVPFGLGVSRSRVAQDPGVPGEGAERGTIVNFASRPRLLRRFPAALRQIMLSIGTWPLALASEIRSPRRG